MIQLPRSFFRQLKAVLRRSIARVTAPVLFQSSPDGLSVKCQQDGIAVVYQAQGGQGNDQLTLPAKALADFDGKGHDLVTLEAKSASTVEARWQDAGVPRSMEYQTVKVDALAAFPDLPARWTQQDVGLLKMLDDAMQSTAQDVVRFALNKIQIRGSSGVIVATDGHQLLWQNGFQFPFNDDVLVPHTNAFGCKEFAGDVAIAKTKTHFWVRVGAWTICLQIDKEGRFPRFETIIPSNTANATHVNFTPEDSAFLGNALPRLPGNDDNHFAVTLDLNGQAVVRARGKDQDRSTEVVLSGATVAGKPVRYAINRQHLAHALNLGFTEGHVITVDSPILFQDQRRKLVIQCLGKDYAVAPSDNDVRLYSDTSESANNNHQPAQRRNETMRPPRQPVPPTPIAPAAPAPVESNGNGVSNGQQQHNPNTFAALLEEGQSIQNSLRDLLLRTNRLMVGLKAYRRHAKHMQSTLASLRQLQQVEA